MLDHDCTIVAHPHVGDLAVHRTRSTDGLAVTSVLAAPGVAAHEVLDAAHEVARDAVPRVSLFDLPLGDGHAWTVTESAGVQGDESLTALLPAWSARSRHALLAPDLGFAAGAEILMRLFGPGPWEAVQTATARYHRAGFEAAAVTAIGVRTSARVRSGRARRALLRFDRPYAAVACVTTDRPQAWHGLPVFSAWVTEPEDAAGP